LVRLSFFKNGYQQSIFESTSSAAIVWVVYQISTLPTRRLMRLKVKWIFPVFPSFIYFKFNASNHEEQTIGKKKQRRRKKNTGKHNFHLKLKQFAGLLRTV
jgi:hypothetical protein